MRRIARLSIALVVMLALSATTALAQNPQFRSQTQHTNLNLVGVNLVANFKATGLGNEPVEVVLSATAQALWACKNNGGNFPNDPKKRTVTATVEGAGVFDPKNGQVSGSLTATPPGSGGLACPGNQVEVLIQVCYSNARLDAYADPGTRQTLLASHIFPGTRCTGILDPDWPPREGLT